MKKVTVIGLGGFGKWVVTLFKDRLMDIYHKEDKIPDEYKWMVFDLTGQESAPEIKTVRFEEGKKVDYSLDYSNTSSEFYQFSGRYLPEIEKIKNKSSDCNLLIKQFMSEEDSGQYIIDNNTKDTPAGERRHTSRITLFLDISKIKSRLENVLKDNSMIFVIT